MSRNRCESYMTQARNRYRLNTALNEDDGGWTKHTQHHWSRIVNDKRLDYWPSTSRFKYEGKTYREFYSGRTGTECFNGTVYNFIATGGRGNE